MKLEFPVDYHKSVHDWLEKITRDQAREAYERGFQDGMSAHTERGVRYQTITSPGEHVIYHGLGHAAHYLLIVQEDSGRVFTQQELSMMIRRVDENALFIVTNGNLAYPLRVKVVEA